MVFSHCKKIYKIKAEMLDSYSCDISHLSGSDVGIIFGSNEDAFCTEYN